MRCLSTKRSKAIYQELYYLNILLTPYFWFYSRIVEAKAPMAIVIPVRGSLPIKGLRVEDLSWQDFLSRVNQTK